jgi:hypothetical protein
MIKKPKTTNEHIISIYGFITGLKKEVNIIYKKILDYSVILHIPA